MDAIHNAKKVINLVRPTTSTINALALEEALADATE